VLRSETRKLFNIEKGTSRWDKKALTYYNEEIRKIKPSSLKWYSQDINNIQSGARLKKIMAKQATNKISTIKLPDAQYTLTGKETLKDLFKFHSPA
jgi:hypothetical protein